MAALNPRLIEQSHGNVYAAQKRKQNSTSQGGRRTRPRVGVESPSPTFGAASIELMSPVSTPIDLMVTTSEDSNGLSSSGSVSALTTSVSDPGQATERQNSRALERQRAGVAPEKPSAIHKNGGPSAGTAHHPRIAHCTCGASG